MDNGVAKIELAISRIKNALNDSVGNERFLQLSTLFAKEQDLIKAKYNKDVSLAKGNSNKILNAELNN